MDKNDKNAVRDFQATSWDKYYKNWNFTFKKGFLIFFYHHKNANDVHITNMSTKSFLVNFWKKIKRNLEKASGKITTFRHFWHGYPKYLQMAKLTLPKPIIFR